MSAPKRTKKPKKTLPLFTFVFSIIVVLLGFILRYHADPIFTGYEPVSKAISSINQPASIFFPAVNFQLAVLPATIRDGKWGVHKDTANFLLSSSSPGQGGNIIIYGHNTQKVFAQLHQLTPGDNVVLKTESNQDFFYIVSEKKIVSPDQIEVLVPTDYEVLTLYTCTGLFDTKRLVVKALPLGQGNN